MYVCAKCHEKDKNAIGCKVSHHTTLSSNCDICGEKAQLILCGYYQREQKRNNLKLQKEREEEKKYAQKYENRGS
jgi:hypothetical protein